MKVLHLITNYAYRGGAEQMLSRLIEYDTNNQHLVVSVLGISESMYKDTLARCEDSMALHWNVRNTLSVLFKLLKFIKKYKPDVIQCWMYHGNFFGALAKIFSSQKFKLFWGVHHSLNSYKQESLSSKVSLFLGRFLAKKTDAVIFCSSVSMAQHEAYGYSGKKNVFIPNGIPIKDFYQDLSQKTFNEPVVFGVAGRYHLAKGYAYLVKAIGLLQKKSTDFCFKLAGREVDSSNSELMSFFKGNGVDLSRVELLGEVQDMHAFYKSIDCFVLSSITEGFPSVLLESMSMGVPCITTDVGEAKLIVNGFGFVVPPKDPQALSEALSNYLALSHDQKRALAKQAQDHMAQSFSIERSVKAYNQVWCA